MTAKHFLGQGCRTRGVGSRCAGTGRVMLQITRRPHAGIVYALAAALCLILTARPICASVPPDRVVVTHHRARISGHEIQYVAVAGTLLIRDARRRPTASIFYVAFIAEGLGP